MSGIPARVVIIGVGNAFRGDDGAGIAVAQRLAEQVPAGTQVLEESGEGAALAEVWKGAQLAIVVDAIQSGATPGTIRRFDARQGPVGDEPPSRSTHGFGISSAIELARALNELPPQLIVYGIEGQDFALGEKLSPAVQEAVPQVAAQVLSEQPESHRVR